MIAESQEGRHPWMCGSALPIVVALGAAFNIAPYALRLLHVLPKSRADRPTDRPTVGGRVLRRILLCREMHVRVGIFLALAIAGVREKTIAVQVPAAAIDRLTLTFGITCSSPDWRRSASASSLRPRRT
jgi:hypothetical protein